MNKTLATLLDFLLAKKYIGGRHIPEGKLIKLVTRNINNHEKREFEREYKRIMNDCIIMRMKKKTGKGDDWHISLNPRELKELMEMLR